MKLTNSCKKDLVFCGFAFLIIVVCYVLITHICGFTHDPMKYRSMLISLTLVVIIDMLFWEQIRIIVLAIDHATWPSVDKYFATETDEKPNHFTYLKTRLNGLRSEVLITDEHRNEAVNQRYKHIAGDVLLYGSYFLALLLNISASQDEHLYYATTMTDKLFSESNPHTMGLLEIQHQYEIFTFVSSTIVEAFNANKSVYGYNGWYAMEQWKMLGATRLRQLRTVNKKIGTGVHEWDDKTYAPQWELPYQRLHYTERFWRIFDPFRPMDVHPSFLNGLFSSFHYIGELQNYPALGGYVALMVNQLDTNRKQVNYLHDSKWLDRYTVALFMDFSMYNADASAFLIITLRIENSPFGTQLPYVGVECVRMLEAVEYFDWYRTILMAMYFICVLQCTRCLVRTLVNDPKAIRELWNLVDLIICLLNVFLLLLYAVREILTDHVLHMLQTSTIEHFLEVQRPVRLQKTIALTKGLLIAISTLRLWKVLQFAYVFQHFTHTLSAARDAVISLGMIILIVLMGLGFGLSLPNGNNAMAFRHIVHAVVTCLWYTVGFSQDTKPKDFFHGGVYFGLQMFLILGFLLNILLINVFASVIYDYVVITERTLKEQQKSTKITFWQFLQVEYGWVMHRLCCLFNRKRYNRRGHTVAENVAMTLDRQEKNELRRSLGRNYKPKHRLTDEEQHADYRRRVHRSYFTGAVLQVQLELFERYLLGDEFGNIPTPPDSDSDSLKWGQDQ